MDLRKVVGAEGFEPPTLWSQTRCATRLRYAPTPFIILHYGSGVAAEMGVVNVARCSYNCAMTSTGIRELKNHLSRYVRRIERGERIAVTAHGRVVAEIGPPSKVDRPDARTRYDELVAAGIVRPPLEPGDPFEDWPDLD